jgi:hypothetical protein
VEIYRGQSAHEIELSIRERKRFQARERVRSVLDKEKGDNGKLTSCPEPRLLFGLTPTDRGRDRGGRRQDLNDDRSDKNGGLGIASREEIPTNKMTTSPPPRAGHNPRPRSAPKVKAVTPITNICVSDCSNGDVKSEKTRTPWLEGRRRYGR